MLEALGAAFVLGFLSEIVDKTQLVILGLALNYRQPWHVFAGALVAHAAMDGIAIALGAVLALYLAAISIKSIVAAGFILLGVWTITKLFLFERKTGDKAVKRSGKSAFLASFLTVLLSEVGDKTQVSSALIAAKYQQPLLVFVGVVTALALAIGLNVFIGTKLADKLPRVGVKLATAATFIAFGIAVYLL